jgi:hypothetical protein
MGITKSLRAYLKPRLIARILKHVDITLAGRFLKHYLTSEWELFRQARQGVLSPTMLELELTTYCERNCMDCYIPREERKDDTVIKEEVAQNAIDRARYEGIHMITMLGGESLQTRTVNLIDSLLAENPDMVFYTCTNADMLAQEGSNLDFLINRNNFGVALSIDGLQQTNDRIRGRNSYRNVMDAADYLRSRRRFFGAVTTMRPENIFECTSHDYVQKIVDSGFIFLLYGVSEPVRTTTPDIALKRIHRLGAYPLFIYDSMVGHVGEQSPAYKVRDIYVDKTGLVMINRKIRSPIGNVTDLANVSGNPAWARRYAPSYPLGCELHI